MQKITSISASLDLIDFDGEELVVRLKKIQRAFQEELFNQFDQGVPVLELLAARSDFIDRLLTLCWHNLMGNSAHQLALLAVGGYGRRELHPYSDIDILVLLEKEDKETYEQAIVNLFTLLWDIGLKPGQSVRTVAECREVARWDQTIMTTLIEARLISGNRALMDVLMQRTGPDQIWPSDRFFLAKLDEQEQRHEKHNNTACNLEPNVKEGPGGLRDIQLIAWIIKRHFDSATLYELVAHSCLTQAEYSEMMSSQKFLWKVRFGLQMLAGRAEDKLLFDYQKQLAAQFGYVDCDQNQAVEQFMQQYYQTVMGLERLNELLLQYFREVMLSQGRRPVPQPINQRFRSVNGMLDVAHPNVFTETPSALLELFILLQKHEELTGVRASTIRLMRHSLYLIDEAFRHDSHCTQLFIDLLKQPRYITRELRRMNRYGVLASYYPPFAQIVGRMQFDLFHAYTVDEHSLLMVSFLRKFSPNRGNQDLPFCNSIFKLIPSPHLLYIAGLLHDISKGQGADHSELGESVAKSFCHQHGITDEATELVGWLVKHHLLMSLTAQRKDITDPEVVLDFAITVQTEERLNYLYLLTVADIRATSPRLWNSWKDSLLRDLYVATYRAFTRGLQRTPNPQEIVLMTQDEARKTLSNLGINNQRIAELWGQLPLEYFSRHNADEISWHTLVVANSSPDELPLVTLRPQNQRGSAEIFVFTKEQPCLFRNMAIMLDQLGLSILEARLITTADQHVINSFQVLEQNGEKVQDIFREQQIVGKLRESILSPAKYPERGITKKISRSSKIFQTATRVHFPTTQPTDQTLIELHTTDRYGLLAIVADIFREFDIKIHAARVITIGNRAEDSFHITTQDDKTIAEEDIRQQLATKLISKLDNLD